MAKRRKKMSREYIVGAIIACGTCAAALAFAAGVGVDNLSQLAAGEAADAMCKGGADAKCPCKTGFKKGTQQCDGKTKGGGKIGCECRDITSGDVAASGKCAVVGKCKADKADGMMPMLPMLPMPMMMPKMEMPMMPQPCVPKTNATTSDATSTSGIQIAGSVTMPGGYDPNCPEASRASDAFSYPVNFNAADSGVSNEIAGGASGGTETSAGTSLWGRLMQSLGISNDSSDGESAGSSGGSGAGGLPGAVKQVTGTKASGSAETNSGVTSDFARKGGSTFTYEASIDDFTQESTGVLSQIAASLKKLLEIVNSWF